MLSKKKKMNGDEEKGKKAKTNGSDSDSSGEECGTVRTHRISTTLRPRITGFTPSPSLNCISTGRQTNPVFFFMLCHLK